MGKLYGQSPSSYIGIRHDEYYMRTAVDLACAVAMWEDENRHYAESRETANNESASIGNVLENYRKQLNERG